MSGTSPGWYDDGRGQQRWWNGVAWSDATRPSSAPQPVPQPVQPRIAPGWYDDGSGAQRWWDGSGWTQHLLPVKANHPPYAGAPEYAGVQSYGQQSMQPGATPATSDDQTPFVDVAVPSAAQIPLAPGFTDGMYASSQQYVSLQQRGQAVEPPRRRAGGLIAAMISIIVLVVLVIVGIVVISRAVQTPSGSPRAVVQAYDEAWADEDCDAFTALTTTGFRSRYYPTCADFTSQASQVDGGYRVDVIETDIAGDRASIVTVEGWPDENTWKMEYSLVREDGDWRIMDIIEVR